jgi:methyl-accepting chemotaxis protein
MFDFLTRFKIGVKLGIAFGLVTVTFAAVLGITIAAAVNVLAIRDVQAHQLFPARAAILGAQKLFWSLDDYGAYQLLATDPSTVQNYSDRYKQTLTAMNGRIAIAERLAATATERRSLADFHRLVDGPDGYYAGSAKALAAAAAGHRSTSQKSYSALPPDAPAEVLERYLVDADAQIATGNAEAAYRERVALILGGALGLGAVVFGIAITAAISRIISRALKTATAALDEIVVEDVAAFTRAVDQLAKGDLTGKIASRRQQLPVRGKDEIAALGTTYNRLALALEDMGTQYTAAIGGLRSLVSSVATASTSLAAASDEASAAAKESTSAVSQITQAVDIVSLGATDQAEKIADTATAIEELSRTADQIAAVASHQAESIAVTTTALAKLDAGIAELSSQGSVLTTSAREATSEAATGDAAVTETAGTITQLQAVTSTAAGAMVSLEQRSAQVEEIVETIEDIADQTNLLALNAAIEAARAGEHGRGFAVVADEVRKLAERSSLATREISKILGAVKKETVAAAEAMRTSSHSMDAGIAVSERASRSLESVRIAIATTSGVAESLANQALEMRNASTRVTDSMDSASAAIDENTAAATEMRSTTEHVTRAMLPIAATAAANAYAANEAALSTRQLAIGIGEIDSSARSLRDQAETLNALVSKFIVEESPEVRALTSVRRTRPLALR